VRLQRIRAQLEKARADMDRLRKARDKAIGDALKAGGSVREVSSIIGIDPARISRVGHEQGWPTPEQVAAREQAADERDAFRKRWG
jgi:hypothetical protein